VATLRLKWGVRACETQQETEILQLHNLCDSISAPPALHNKT